MKRVFFTTVVILCLMGVHSGMAMAESKITAVSVLEEVIVTDSVKNRTLVDTPSAITVLTETDIKNSGQTQLQDFLSSIPGVVNQKAGSKTYFSIRGTRTTLSNGPAIYVDGRPLNTGLYNYSKVDTIPLDNIERIEVIKAPPASIYGANAARGVILITTKSGKRAGKVAETDVAVEYGSWDTFKTTAAMSGTTGGFDYNLTGHTFRTDGYRDSDEEVDSIDAQAGYRFDWGRVDVIAGYNDSFSRFPTGLTLHQLGLDRRAPGYDTKTDGTGYYVLPNESDEEMTTAGLTFRYDSCDWLLTGSFMYVNDEQLFTQFKDFNDSKKKQDDYQDDREQDKYDFKLTGGRTFTFLEERITNTLTAGFNYFLGEYDQIRAYPHNDTGITDKMISGKAKADIDIENRMHAFHATNDFSWDRFRVLAGFRVNYVDYELTNKEPKSFDKSYDGEWDWNVAPSFSVVPNGNAFVSYTNSHWYLPMSFYKTDLEKQYKEALPENLEPETYETWELGFKHRWHRVFNYSLVYYHTEIEDKLVSVYDDKNKFQGYRNGGTSTHKGIELEVDGRPFDFLGYRISLATIDAEWDQGLAKAYDTPDGKKTRITDLAGKTVLRVPEYEYNVGIDLFPVRDSRMGDVTLSVDVRGFGEQYEDYNNNLEMDPADFVDMKVTWNYKQVELYLVGRNIFDEEWDKYINSLGKSHDRLGGMSGIYPQDGAYWGIGGSIRF